MSTPYPWRRNQNGDLIGANGHAIYFMGADAVLVEHSPSMLEALISIRTQAATAPRNAGNLVLLAILRKADDLISTIERANASTRRNHRTTGQVSG